MTAPFRKTSRSSLLCCLIAMLIVFTLAANVAAFAQDTSADGFTTSPPNSVGITLQGCRNDGSLNPTNFPMNVGGTPYYVCPNAMYTTGNLGKNWAELDNVPFRLVIKDNETPTGTTLTYNVVVAGDHFDDPPTTQRVGYFVVSAPEPDPGCALGSCLASTTSDPACSVTVVSSGGDRFATGITGGTYDTIYETLAISQPTGSTCVFDYYQKLAIGAHLFDGSNLQAYKFEDVGFKVGKQTVPLPVNPNTPTPPPQALSKTMGASEGQGNIWTVAKTAPATASFNSCDLNDTSKNLSVLVTWTKQAGAGGNILVTTNVYETNPSLVTIVANVTDTISATPFGGGTPVAVPSTPGTPNGVNITVPPNTTTLVLTDTATLDPTLYQAPFSDHAVADLSDTSNNQLGQVTADASTSTITQGSGSDDSADVTDSESISDTANALTFSVQDTVPSGLGTFTLGGNPYTLPGASTVGPLLWDSGSQSTSGSIQFDKTVYLNPAGTATTGDLTDTATATASDSQTTNSDSADVKITSAPVTKLTINKTLDSAVATDQVFTFDVFDSGSNKVATATITVKATQTTGSVDVTTLAPGTFIVSEENPGAPWQPLPSQQATLSTGNLCTNSVEFDNIHAADLTVSKTATPAFKRTYTWGITKAVDKTTIDTTGAGATFNYTVNVTHDSGTDSGWTVKGTIMVTNPNAEDFTGVGVTDAIDNGGSCSLDNTFDGVVKANSSVNLNYTCTYASAPSSTGFTNTATASWSSSYGTPDTTKSGTKAGDFSTTSPTPVDDSVTVTDTFGGTLGTVSSSDTSPKTFTYSHTFTGDTAGTCTKHDNTATFTTDTTSTTGSDSKEVTVCVGADLSVSKTAAVTTPTYSWTLTKAASPNGTVEQSGSATLKYTVTASYTKTGSWTVYGTITVSNPNDWESITGVTVTDALDTGSNGVCAVTGGTNVTVPKRVGLVNGSVALNYTCTYSAVPSPTSGTNTATATWTAASFFTPHGTKSGTASYAFSPLTSGPTTVTITDAFNGGTATTLGVINALTNGVTGVPNTVTLTSTPPSFKFTYSHVVTVTGGTCSAISNTAKVVDTNLVVQATATATVTVCNTKTGALTMGFWNNKNGQAIITGGGSTGGVCYSGTFLRGYAPFQDLSATASCSAVASYVSNIIKLANASGASMNAMLKAQMLATALDVYFSDPALGGNKIGAPAPVGGVKIDLTQVCIMIDSTGGTASCSGKTESCSSAFGGATCQTVSWLLSYAASQSNSGGTSWYGQNKTTQGLAKNTFDAINNQAAYICP